MKARHGDVLSYVLFLVGTGSRIRTSDHVIRNEVTRPLTAAETENIETGVYALYR